MTSENIPFHLAGGQNPLILVPVYVDRKGPYQFILDTGASHCLLSQELSATLGIRPETEKQAMGAGGPVKLTIAHVSSLRLVQHNKKRSGGHHERDPTNRGSHSD